MINMVSINGHFISGYIYEFIELLHKTLDPTWFYKSEIIEIPELLTAILITYDDQEDDEYILNVECDWEVFLERMSFVLWSKTRSVLIICLRSFSKRRSNPNLNA